jgi:hypothetical protein
MYVESPSAGSVTYTIQGITAAGGAAKLGIRGIVVFELKR